MDLSLLTTEQQAQYSKDLLLAERLRALGLSFATATNLENLIPAQALESLFNTTLVTPGDDTVLREYALKLIRDYASDLKQSFLEDSMPTTPPAKTPVPITSVEIANAVSKGWVFVSEGNRYSVSRNEEAYSIEQTIDKTEFNNLLKLI
jgi:hypothetical protein